MTFSFGAFGSPDKHHAHNNASKVQHKVNRKDPAFVAGYDEGYRQGANDCHALANYSDQGGPACAQATDGYTAQYGDKEVYQQRFRLGYIERYKAGWDYNAGMYNPLGAGKLVRVLVLSARRQRRARLSLQAIHVAAEDGGVAP